jgi:hypothetical protein
LGFSGRLKFYIHHSALTTHHSKFSLCAFATYALSLKKKPFLFKQLYQIMKFTGLLLGLLLLSAEVFSQKAYHLASPNARVNLTVNVSNEGKLLYALNLAQTSVVKPSSLGFKLQNLLFLSQISP